MLKTEATPVPGAEKMVAGQHKEDVMRKFRWLLIAMLVALPLAVVPAANAQVGVGVGVGPAVVGPGYYGDYGPPACEWGYYA